jgi:hypothetical protein
MDMLSRGHYKAVLMEIEGRFFSQLEADMLKLAIDERTIINEQLRAAAAQAWEPR